MTPDPNPADLRVPAAYPDVFYPGQVYPSQPFDQIGYRNYLAAYDGTAPDTNNQWRRARAIPRRPAGSQ